LLIQFEWQQSCRVLALRTQRRPGCSLRRARERRSARARSGYLARTAGSDPRAEQK